MPFSAGHRLGPYEVTATIGEGGMGTVYKARDTRLDRMVAIKVSGERFSARFDHEARMVATLNHPNICTIHDVGPDYLVMEYIEGVALHGPLPLDQAITFGTQILDALDHAHRRGIFHRDLKPANILVTRKGVKLLDFGLAARAESATPAVAAPAPNQSTITIALSTGEVISGTPSYMSPEQVESKEADARSDIFSFGCVLYEMLTGKQAFEGATVAATIGAVLAKDPAPMSSIRPEIPPALERIVATSIAKDRDQRWQSALDLKHVLEALPLMQPPSVSHGRGTWAWPVAAVAGVLALVFTARMLFQPAPADTAPIAFDIHLPGSLTQSSAVYPISPDGSKIAFETSENGKGRVYVRTLDSTELRPVPGTEDLVFPSWSPDSKSLFVNDGNRLQRVDLAGGGARVVVEGSMRGPIAVLPSGDILLSRDRVIQKVTPGGDASTAVTKFDASREEEGHTYPQLLPDGRRFLFVAAGKPPRRSLVLGSLDAPGHRLILDDSPIAFPVLLRRGQSRELWLVYRRESLILAQRFDADGAKLTGEPVQLADNALDVNAPPPFFAATADMIAWRPDTSREGSAKVSWVDRTGKEVSTLPPEAVGDQLALSADGRRLVVSRPGTRRDTRQLWLTDLARGVSTALTFGENTAQAPAWAPDSKRLAYSLREKDGTWKLIERDVDTGSEGRVVRTPPGFLRPTGWSPDGKNLLASFTIPPALRLLSMETGEATPLNGVRGPANHASFSPDGNYISYESNESGRPEVYVIEKPPGAGRWQISGAGGSHARWSGNGKELFYVSLDLKLMSVEVKTSPRFQPGSPEPRFAVPGFRLGFFPIRYAVAHDGKSFLLYERDIRELQRIMVLRNWASLIKNP